MIGVLNHVIDLFKQDYCTNFTNICILLVSGPEVMIKRDGWGHSYLIVEVKFSDL